MVRVDLSALPKTGFKNNRIHTYTTVKNGTQYCIPTYVELVANGEKICCELKPKLVGMDKFDKRYKCVVRDDILGNIIVWFDDLLQTKTFANRIKDELTRHLNNIDELAKKIDKANEFATEQQQRANIYNEKYTTASITFCLTCLTKKYGKFKAFNSFQIKFYNAFSEVSLQI